MQEMILPAYSEGVFCLIGVEFCSKQYLFL
jgi:hypothetical protein